MRPPAAPRAHSRITDMLSVVARLAREATTAAAASARPLVSPPSSQSSNWATSSTSTSVSSLFSGRRSRSSGRSSLIPSTATRAASSGSSASSSSSIENLAAASPKRPPRFYVEPEQLSSSPSSSLSGSVVLLPATEARHARKVLRLRPGAPLELCDGRGRVAKAVLLEQESKNDPASVRIEGEVAALTVPLPRLTLAVAALGLKGGRGDWLVEKAAELGAASLVPLATERSPVSDRDDAEEDDDEDAGTERRRRSSVSSTSTSSSSTSSRSSRWRRLAEAAGKQCLRAHALGIERAATVEELASRIKGSPSSLALVAAEGAPPVAGVLLQEKRVREEKEDRKLKIELVFLVVGPEGDFTPRELEVLFEAGAKPVGLGSNRLRVETAAEALLVAAGMILG